MQTKTRWAAAIIALVAVFLAVISSGQSTVAQENPDFPLEQERTHEPCGEIAGVPVYPDGTVGKVPYCKTPTTPDSINGCGEIAGIEVGSTYIDLCATKTQSKPSSTPTPSTTSQAVVAQPAPTQIEQSRSDISPEAAELEKRQSTPNNPIVMSHQDGWWYGDDDEDWLSNGSEMSWPGQNAENPWDNMDVTGGHVMNPITKRYPDCVVDAVDSQAVAFRWGVQKGNPIYKESMNVEPDHGGDDADNDIDINDLQTIFSRFGQTCTGNIQEPNWNNNACGGVFHTIEQIQDDRAAAGLAVQNAIDASGGIAGEMLGNLSGLADSDPTILTDGESKTYCIPFYHPDNGEIIDLIELTMTSEQESTSGVSAEEWVLSPVANNSGGLVMETCINTDTWRSFAFGTTVAKITHTKNWGWVKDTSNIYYLMIGFNPPSIKEKYHPYAQVGDSPVPTDFWWYEPFAVQSNAQTEFKQRMLWTWSSTRLESNMIVGPGDSCIKW